MIERADAAGGLALVLYGLTIFFILLAASVYVIMRIIKAMK